MTIACVLRSGGCFTPVWVQRLQRQCAEHMPECQFVCLSDVPVEGVETISLVHDWPGWWAKLELFRPGNLANRILYLDLDTLVLGRFAFPESLRLHMLSDLFKPNVPASGAMAWIPCLETEAIYHNFCLTGESYMRLPKWKRNLKSGAFGDGGFIGQYPHLRLQDELPGVFNSAKVGGIMEKGPGKWPVVCFHGSPRFHELDKNHWARKHWEGR